MEVIGVPTQNQNEKKIILKLHWQFSSLHLQR